MIYYSNFCLFIVPIDCPGIMSLWNRSQSHQLVRMRSPSCLGTPMPNTFLLPEFTRMCEWILCDGRISIIKFDD